MEKVVKEMKRGQRDRDSQQIQEIRDEMLNKIAEKNSELRMLELEI